MEAISADEKLDDTLLFVVDILNEEATFVPSKQALGSALVQAGFDNATAANGAPTLGLFLFLPPFPRCFLPFFVRFLVLLVGLAYRAHFLLHTARYNAAMRQRSMLRQTANGKRRVIRTKQWRVHAACICTCTDV